MTQDESERGTEFQVKDQGARRKGCLCSSKPSLSSNELAEEQQEELEALAGRMETTLRNKQRRPFHCDTVGRGLLPGLLYYNYLGSDWPPFFPIVGCRE